MLPSKNTNKYRSNYGFTLIELILSLSLASILLTILFMINTDFYKNFSSYYNNLVSDENANYAITKITNELKRCNDISQVTVKAKEIDIKVNNVTEDFYYDNINKCIKAYRTTGGSEVAYYIEDFNVFISGNTVEIRIKSFDKLLSAIVTLRYNGSDDFEN